jgi:hypothetical protein
VQGKSERLYKSLYAVKVVLALREIMTTQCTDEAQHLLVARRSNSTDRRICQHQSPYRRLSSISWNKKNLQ